MVKVHRAMLDQLGPPPVPAVLLDTPFAFQENAAELSERVRRYFAESLRADIDVAPGGPLGGHAFSAELLVTSVRGARYVFAGPGSPSYALRKWATTVVPSLLVEKLRHGGGVTFSSAAALTLGVRTVPVYEIYKVGEDPHWLVGMDVLAAAGMNAAVIPHYNNAEGGTHDTRYCYLGERRLLTLETELPDGAFVLGIDEHTAITFDLDEQVGSITGLGVVTVRAAGRSRTFAAGTTVGIDEILGAAEDLARGGPGSSSPSDVVEAGVGVADEQAGGTGGGGAGGGGAGGGAQTYADSPLIDVVREQEKSYFASLERRDVHGAVGALLELEDQITKWATDIPAGDAMDRARASLRSLILELARVAEGGARDPREVVGPFVEAMLELRARARADRRFEEADQIRERLEELGVEVRDAPGGSEWLLA
jgi:hypothetical protein